LLEKVAEKGRIVATVVRGKAATGVSSWLVGQGINAVSEIEERPRITPWFRRESQVADRNTRL
jgi:hypothetical protein